MHLQLRESLALLLQISECHAVLKAHKSSGKMVYFTNLCNSYNENKIIAVTIG